MRFSDGVADRRWGKGSRSDLSPTYRLNATTLYSFLMSFPPLLSLHHYFVVAARMRHHFESNLVAVEEPSVAALQDPDLAVFELFSGPRGNFMYYWYASLYVVVQGYRNLKLIDPRILQIRKDVFCSLFTNDQVCRSATSCLVK